MKTFIISAVIVVVLSAIFFKLKSSSDAKKESKRLESLRVQKVIDMFITQRDGHAIILNRLKKKEGPQKMRTPEMVALLESQKKARASLNLVVEKEHLISVRVNKKGKISWEYLSDLKKDM